MKYNRLILFICMFIAGLFTFSHILKADPKIKWSFLTNGPVYSSPTYFNGNIYIGSDDGNLYCIDAAAGIKKWAFKTGGIIRCTPAVSNGNVYFDSDDGNLYSLNCSSGDQNWSFNIGTTQRVLPSPVNLTGNYWDYRQSSPCIDSGVVYVGSGDNNLYAIDTAGNLKWKAKTKNIIRSSPCVYKGNVYVGSWDGCIYSFRKIDGSLVWKYNPQGIVNPSPCIADSILYCGCRNYYFYALNANTGEFYWKYMFSAGWVESSATFVNGSIYIGSSDDDMVLSFNPGEKLVLAWRTNVGMDAWSKPAYDNGTIYIGLASYKNSLTALAGGGMLAINASTGKINWRLDCGQTPFIGGVASSPTVVNDVIYYGSIDSNVYAVVNTTTSVDNKQGSLALPDGYNIANYPNPFNPGTKISYAIPVSGNISIKIYNILGQEIATVFQGFQKAGAYVVDFDASKLASGVYLYRLQAGNFSEAKKMVVTK